MEASPYLLMQRLLWQQLRLLLPWHKLPKCGLQSWQQWGVPNGCPSGCPSGFPSESASRAHALLAIFLSPHSTTPKLYYWVAAVSTMEQSVQKLMEDCEDWLLSLTFFFNELVPEFPLHLTCHFLALKKQFVILYCLLVEQNRSRCLPKTKWWWRKKYSHILIS